MSMRFELLIHFRLQRLRAVEKGQQGSTEYPGPSCCQTQCGLVLLVTCFVLVLVFRPAQGISHRYADRNQQVLECDSPKKSGHRLLMLRIGYNG